MEDFTLVCRHICFPHRCATGAATPLCRAPTWAQPAHAPPPMTTLAPSTPWPHLPGRSEGPISHSKPPPHHVPPTALTARGRQIHLAPQNADPHRVYGTGPVHSVRTLATWTMPHTWRTTPPRGFPPTQGSDTPCTWGPPRAGAAAAKGRPCSEGPSTTSSSYYAAHTHPWAPGVHGTRPAHTEQPPCPLWRG